MTKLSRPHPSFREVGCPNCSTVYIATLEKGASVCVCCGFQGMMVVKSPDEITKKVVVDDDLWK